STKIAGIMVDLNLTEEQYRWCLTAPYIIVVVISIPVNILLRKSRPSLLVGFLALIWGGVSMGNAGVTNFTGLLLCQIISGVAGTVAFRGLIAYGASQIPASTLNSWQWLFIIFGIPSVIGGFLCLFFLPESPETAEFLNDNERKLATTRLYAERAYSDAVNSWSWAQVISVLKDWKLYWYSIIFMLGAVASSGGKLNLPSIIDGMGDWSKSASLALTTPPQIVGCIAIYFSGWLSDKLGQRAYIFIGAHLVMAFGLFLIIFIPDEQIGVRYFAVCCLISGWKAFQPVRSSWGVDNFSGLTRRAVATAVFFIFESSGNAIGGQAYFDGPRYTMGHTIALSAVGLNIILAIGLRLILKRINNQREKVHIEQDQHTRDQVFARYGGDEIIGDRHPDYRYTL
ncbi:major facilitator superfamily domain-containing protein, partial [Phascolomyces articulosus]